MPSWKAKKCKCSCKRTCNTAVRAVMKTGRCSKDGRQMLPAVRVRRKNKAPEAVFRPLSGLGPAAASLGQPHRYVMLPFTALSCIQYQLLLTSVSSHPPLGCLLFVLRLTLSSSPSTPLRSCACRSNMMLARKATWCETSALILLSLSSTRLGAGHFV